MTLWLSLEQGVRFTIRCIEQMQGAKSSFRRSPV